MGDAEKCLFLPPPPLPANWQDFLKVGENKEELFGILASHVANADIPPRKILLTNLHTDVECTSPHKNVTRLRPCLQEEADARIMFHIADCVHGDLKKLYYEQ